MSQDNSKDYKTGSVKKAAEQIKNDRDTKKKRLDEIMKQMQSSTVGGK